PSPPSQRYPLSLHDALPISENWSRPKFEVNALMRLLASSLRREANKLDENNIRLDTIGQIDRFPRKCRQQLEEAIELTKENTRLDRKSTRLNSSHVSISYAV